MQPMNKLLEIFNDEKFHTHEKTYTELKDSFLNNYHSEHPVIKILKREKLR